MTTYTTRNNHPIETDSELGKGGEGAVYSLRQHTDFVAKIYHPAHRTAEKEPKLLAMVDNAPNDDTRRLNPPHISIAWPVDVLYERGQMAGYVMPKIKTSPEIFVVFNPQTRRKSYPNFDWRYMHRVAQNLAIAFNALHTRGYVIGDVNLKNALVTDLAMVSLVDTDSFQVKDANGRIYRCPVGLPEYTPPELQGVRLETIDRFDYHDNFGLAVLIFQLLMDGNHPFRGVPQNIHLSVGIADLHCIKQGIFPYQPNREFSLRPHAPRFDALHPEIRRLFVQTFAQGYKNPAARTGALEWVKALGVAENNLIQCKSDPMHWYSGHLTKCPWCERQKQGGVVPIQNPINPVSPPAQITPAAAAKRAQFFCTHCGTGLVPGQVYCPKCTQPFMPGPCPHCKKHNVPQNALFCPDCGKRV